MIMPRDAGGHVPAAAPPGFNLYWLASNLCSIVQQAVTLRILRAREEPGRRGAAASEGPGRFPARDVEYGPGRRRPGARACPKESLRYVVLEAGSPAGPRRSPARPARIAVLVDARCPRRPRRPRVCPRGPRGEGRAGGPGHRARDRGGERGLEAAAEVEESPDALTVRVEGPGRRLFLDDDADVLEALEPPAWRACTSAGSAPDGWS